MRFLVRDNEQAMMQVQRLVEDNAMMGLIRSDVSVMSKEHEGGEG